MEVPLSSDVSVRRRSWCCFIYNFVLFQQVTLMYHAVVLRDTLSERLRIFYNIIEKQLLGIS